MRRSIAVLIAALAVLGITGLPSTAAEGVRIRVLSNRADLISGSNALVQVLMPIGADPARMRVALDGRDVTNSFAVRADGRYLGLLDGLRVGGNELTARGPGGAARIRITNHPIGGPVFAGPHVQPWLCKTDCDAATRFDFFYKSTDPLKPGFRPYDVEHPPADLARTTTDHGENVPFIVRRETGTMDRGTYAVGALYDPARPWEPWSVQSGWNGKLIWPFGGDCKPWHRQAEPIDVLGGVQLDPGLGGLIDPGLDEALGSILGNGNAAVGLSRGFMVATSSLNKLGEQCNPVVSAEAVMMLKEHITETYGQIRYTIGAGGSAVRCSNT